MKLKEIVFAVLIDLKSHILNNKQQYVFPKSLSLVQI